MSRLADRQERMEATLSAAGQTRASQGVVAVLSRESECGRTECHDRVTRDGIARRLALLKGFEFAGEHDRLRRYPGPLYLVPAEPVPTSGSAMLSCPAGRSSHPRTPTARACISWSMGRCA